MEGSERSDVEKQKWKVLNEVTSRRANAVFLMTSSNYSNASHFLKQFFSPLLARYINYKMPHKEIFVCLPNNPLNKIYTEGLKDILDFIYAVKKVYPDKLGGVDNDNIDLQCDGTLLQRSLLLSELPPGNTRTTPFLIIVSSTGKLRFYTNRFCLHSPAIVAGTRTCLKHMLLVSLY